jgi:signal transduction histidine kinase
VHNNGTIAPELLPTIFDPFRSADRKRDRGEGLGLGLFIAKAIAHAHNGTIEVESTPQRGTTFRLMLPRQPATARAATA